jgi:hypothetical protein
VWGIEPHCTMPTLVEPAILFRGVPLTPESF